MPYREGAEDRVAESPLPTGVAAETVLGLGVEAVRPLPEVVVSSSLLPREASSMATVLAGPPVAPVGSGTPVPRFATATTAPVAVRRGSGVSVATRFLTPTQPVGPGAAAAVPFRLPARLRPCPVRASRPTLLGRR